MDFVELSLLQGCSKQLCKNHFTRAERRRYLVSGPSVTTTITNTIAIAITLNVGVSVILTHPGLVDTDMIKAFDLPKIQPDVSAKNLIKRIDELTIDNTCTFCDHEGNALAW